MINIAKVIIKDNASNIVISIASLLYTTNESCLVREIHPLSYADCIRFDLEWFTPFHYEMGWRPHLYTDYSMSIVHSPPKHYNRRPFVRRWAAAAAIPSRKLRPVPRRTGAQWSRRKGSSGAGKHESMKIKKVDYIVEYTIIGVSVSADAAATTTG